MLHNIYSRTIITMTKAKHFIKSEAVLIISVILAAASCFFVPVGKNLIECIDLNVLSLLFCLMLVVAGLRDCRFMEYISVRLLSKCNRTRPLAIILCLLTYFASMLLTNDVALIAFVPFTILLFERKPRVLLPALTLQTVSANIGSMVTPFGNPQNIYIFSNGSFSAAEFFAITVPTAAMGLALTLLMTLLIKNESVSEADISDISLRHKSYLWIYLALFVLCILTVFKVFDFTVMFASALLSIFILDISLFRKVDYGLLITFACFFIFTENVSHIPEVAELIRQFVNTDTMLTSVLLSQVISNVPAAILLSAFTENTTELLLGVNIGGLGMLIASLASLISFKQYAGTENARIGKYLLVFTLVNLVLLIILFAFASVFSL